MSRSTLSEAPAVASSPLTLRVLAPEEWPRMRAIEPFKSHGLPDDPTNWVILVVERGATIVGSCSLFTAMHWDCWYIDRDEPGQARGIILRQLLRQALSVLSELHIDQVYTGVEPAAPGSNAAAMLKRFGFKPAAGRLFSLKREG